MLSAGGDGDCIQWRWCWWRPVESKAPCLGGDARPGDWSIISMIFTRRSWHGTRDRSRTTPTRVNIHLKLSPNYIYSFSSVLRFWLTIMSPMQWPLPMVGRTLKLCGVHYVIRHWKIEKFEVFSIHKLQSSAANRLIGEVVQSRRRPNFTSTYREVNACLALCLNSVLNVKAVVVVDAFNQEWLYNFTN